MSCRDKYIGEIETIIRDSIIEPFRDAIDDLMLEKENLEWEASLLKKEVEELKYTISELRHELDSVDC